MRRLFWFTVGFALSCGLILSLLWDYGAVCLIASIVLCVPFAVLSGRGRWARYPAMVLLGIAVGSGMLLCRQRMVYRPLLCVDGVEMQCALTAQADSVPGRYGHSVKALLSLENHTYPVRVYLSREQTARAGDSLEGTFLLRATVPGGSKAESLESGRGILAVASPKGTVTIIPGSDAGLRFLPQRLTRAAQQALDRSFPEDAAAFAKSLFLGDTTDLSYEADTALRISGIRHIVAVSGLHVALLFGILWFLCGKRPLPAFLVGIPVLFLFGSMAGLTPSVTRACLMAGLLVLARLTRRCYDPLTAWAFAVLWLLLGNPFCIAAAGFQLSALCVLGILLFQRPMARRLQDLFRKIPKGAVLADSLAVSLSATVLSLPVSVFYFGMASLIAPLTNLLVLWVLPFVFCGILTVCILGPLLPGLAAGVGWLTAWPIRLILAIAGALSRVPMAAVYTCSPYTVPWLILVYGLAILWLALGRRRGWIFVCTGVASLAVVTALWGYGPRQDVCRLTVLDVGEGQSLLLQSGAQSALIDCGGYSDTVSADRAWQMLRSQNIYRLDLLLFTHFDRDHFGGTANFLTQIPAEKTMLPGPSELLPLGQVVTQDCAVPFGEGSLHFFPYTGGNQNQENSMAILFETENCAILITGDLDVAGERRLVRAHDLSADILVVGHHGSKYATCAELLEAVQPELALISVGENNYGHPTQEVLDRLEAAGCTVRRTDTEGTIIIRR